MTGWANWDAAIAAVSEERRTATNNGKIMIAREKGRLDVWG
jgi:hypothetical protein